MAVEAQKNGHEITMTDRTRMSVTGVNGVDCFNEEMIVLDTGGGMLTVSGEGLHIANLNLQQGCVQISGTLRALEYSDRSPLRGGLLRRIFR